MHAKKTGCFLSLLLLSTAFLFTVDALPDSTASFRGVGVTIDLTFPEEASPLDNIFHNLTITAYNFVNSLNITLVIYAPIDLAWQIIDSPHNIPWLFPLNVNKSLPTAEINFTLPQNANGLLKCKLYVQTNQTTDYPSFIFYTTLVSEPTFSEMQTLYNEMKANYTLLQENYAALMNDYNGLWADYSTLFDNYTALVSEHNELLTEYSAQVASYEALEKKYKNLQSEVSSLSSSLNTKSSDYNSLQTSFGSLNSTFSSLEGNYTELQGNYTVLEGFYNSLNDVRTQLEDDYSDLQSSSDVNRVVMFILVMIVAGLIALIIYIRRRESEPYVIIRKETVALKPDKKS